MSSHRRRHRLSADQVCCQGWRPVLKSKISAVFKVQCGPFFSAQVFHSLFDTTVPSVIIISLFHHIFIKNVFSANQTASPRLVRYFLSLPSLSLSSWLHTATQAFINDNLITSLCKRQNFVLYALNDLSTFRLPLPFT